ncbi:molybdate ABC transporter substrate-binding protein [uncultured Endozoicomonas sp.]|uniref:molybdate ABC transporter substrate-binding protein n=1 Tax=uncultured Endozoicomonas sp. TaxID=432652 RepID=UPI00262EF629|nr:molybdate ABC transporter substrate-binding protein [uncultured Endozoicomonas sp.]
MKKLVLVVSLLFLSIAGRVAIADILKVAVAANFKPTLEDLAEKFEQETGHRLLISAASTGILFNQIVNGAPFDIFLSADRQRPEMLKEKGMILPGSQHTYAMGELVLWSPGESTTLVELRDNKARLAIANPAIAPYGLAAQQLLENLGIWSYVESRLVKGASIQQTWQFVASGNVPVGLVAKAQMVDGDQYTVMPYEYYDPIQQDMVILKRTPHPDAAKQFVEFILSESAQSLIESHGYFSVVKKDKDGSLIEKALIDKAPIDRARIESALIKD